MEKAYAMYLRKSRKDAAGESVEETLARHEQRLLQLAQQQGLVIGTVYREVVSGDSIAARPEMQRLLQAVQRGQYQGVLVVELERLARGDTKDQGVVAEAFQCSGTRIVTPAKTYDPDNEFDEEYFEFGLFMSRREYKTIKRRMQAGVRQSVGAGNYLPPCAPFGYDIFCRGRRDRTLVPNGDAPVVRLIFQWYAAGCSCPEIARRLTALGCRTATGRTRWPPTSVAKILHNDVYLGRVHYGTYRQRKEFDEAACQFRLRARAQYYAAQRGVDFSQGQVFGPHGQQLVVANAAGQGYDDARSRQLTQDTVTANLQVRALGYKPYIAPGLSSAAISVLRTLRGENHDGTLALGGAYFGCSLRSTRLGVEPVYQALHPALQARLAPVLQALREFDYDE